MTTKPPRSDIDDLLRSFINRYYQPIFDRDDDEYPYIERDWQRLKSDITSQAPPTNEDAVREAVLRSAWTWNDGWRFCDTKFDELSDKFQKIILDELGNHPLGHYVYSDDCACQIEGKETPEWECGCSCHKKARAFADEVIANLKKVTEGGA